MVHVSEISGDKRGNPLSRFQIDDVIQTKVINVSRREKKIGLSIRKLEQTSEKEIFKSYVNNQKEATSNLGDLLREEMMNLGRQNIPDDLDPQKNRQSKALAGESGSTKSSSETD